MSDQVLVPSQIDDHVAFLKDLVGQGETRFVELRAPSGSGKSRAVRELYRHLVDGQSLPGYWPGRLMADDDSMDPLRARKVLGPSEERLSSPPGALPDFLRLTVCATDRQDGGPGDAVHQLARQLDLHEVPLLVAGLERAGRSLQWRESGRQLLQDFAALSAEELRSAAVDGLVAGVVGAVLPGTSVVEGVARRIWERRRRRTDAQDTVSKGMEITSSAVSVIDGIRERVVDAARFLPVVMVIEDAHLADKNLVDLLIGLSRTEARVLVVATCWPEGVDRDQYQRLLASLETTRGLYQQRIFHPWGSAELMGLAREVYPSTSDEVLSCLAERFRTPLSLLLCLTLPTLRSRVTDGRLQLTEAQIRSLPADPKGLQLLRWQELESHVQEALVLAMAITGAQGFENGTSFVRQVALQVGRARGLLLDGAYETASEHDHWISELLDGVDSYREPLLADLVLGKVQEHFLEEDLQSLVVAAWGPLVNQLNAAYESDGRGSSQDLLARWALALAPAVVKALGPQEAVMYRAAVVRARHLLHLHDPEAALEILDAIGIENASGATGLERARLRYLAARDAARLTSAIDAAREVLRLLEARPEVDREQTTAIALDLAFWLRTDGQLEAARSIYEDAIKDLSAGGSAELLVGARAALAAVIGYQGDPLQAELDLKELCNEAALSDDISPRLALCLRRMRWRWAGAGGRVLAACGELPHVHKAMSEALGPDDPDTLFALTNYAYFLDRAGDRQESLRVYEQVVQGRTRALGERHPHTIDTLRNLARVECTGVDARAAAGILSRLLEERLTALEAHNPLLLATRLDYAIALAEADAQAEAVTTVTDLALIIGETPTQSRIMATIGEYGDVGRTRERLDRLRVALRDEQATRLVERWRSAA